MTVLAVAWPIAVFGVGLLNYQTHRPVGTRLVVAARARHGRGFGAVRDLGSDPVDRSRPGLRWWFAPRASVTFDTNGLTIDEQRGVAGTRLAWGDVHGVDYNMGAYHPLTIMGVDWQRIRGVPSDLWWVRQPGRAGVYSFAMALVSVQPTVYSLWGEDREGIPQGAHLADPGEDVAAPVPLPDKEAVLVRRAAVVGVLGVLVYFVVLTIIDAVTGH